MSNKFTPKNLQEAFIPLRVANWIVGIVIFEHPFTRIRLLCTLLYVIVIMTSYVFDVYLFIDEYESLTEPASTILKANVLRTLFATNLLLLLNAHVQGWIYKKKLKQLLEHLEDSNKLLETIGVMKNDKKVFFLLIGKIGTVIMIIMTIGIVNCHWMGAEPHSSSWILQISIYYPIITYFLVDCCFSTWITYIGEKFKQMNNSIQSMSKITPPSLQDEKLSEVLPHVRTSRRRGTEYFKDEYRILRTVRKIHWQLTKLSQELNAMYRIHLLLSMIVSIVVITGFLYYAYIIIRKKKMSAEDQHRELSGTIFWVTLYALRIVMMCKICSTTSNEATKTLEIMYELCQSSIDGKDLRMEIEEFSLTMIHKPLTFTVCGLFTLDYAFLREVVGSIMTYLLILIQLSD